MRALAELAHRACPRRGPREGAGGALWLESRQHCGAGRALAKRGKDLRPSSNRGAFSTPRFSSTTPADRSPSWPRSCRRSGSEDLGRSRAGSRRRMVGFRMIDVRLTPWTPTPMPWRLPRERSRSPIGSEAGWSRFRRRRLPTLSILRRQPGAPDGSCSGSMTPRRQCVQPRIRARALPSHPQPPGRVHTDPLCRRRDRGLETGRPPAAVRRDRHSQDHQARHDPNHLGSARRLRSPGRRAQPAGVAGALTSRPRACRTHARAARVAEGGGEAPPPVLGSKPASRGIAPRFGTRWSSCMSAAAEGRMRRRLWRPSP